MLPDIAAVGSLSHLLPSPSVVDGDEGEPQRTPNAQAHRQKWWRDAACRLWPAWKALGRWEEAAVGEVGPEFGELVMLLWSVHRFAGSDSGIAVFDQIVDENFRLVFADPVTVDVVEVAFALGAAWGESRSPMGPPARILPVVLSPDRDQAAR